MMVKITNDLYLRAESIYSIKVVSEYKGEEEGGEVLIYSIVNGSKSINSYFFDTRMEAREFANRIKLRINRWEDEN